MVRPRTGPCRKALGVVDALSPVKRPAPASRGHPGPLLGGLVAVCLAVAWMVAARPAGAQSGFEHIRSYIVNIDIARDGKLTIVERIDYDFASTQHHGIFRDIPVRFHYDDTYDRVYPLDAQSVQATGGASPKYKIEHEGSTLRIRIGDPNKTISGRHVYTITYTVEGALNGFSDHDELYWNAVGTEWGYPINKATARVTTPADITQVVCFTGSFGSNQPCQQSSSSGRTATFSQSGLQPYEALSVVVGLPRGAVSPPPKPILKERWSISRAFALTPVTVGLSGGLFLLLLAGLFAFLWRLGRDRRAVGSPIDIAYGSASDGEQAVPLFERSDYPVEYAPPEDIRPGQVGTLIDEVANPLDITATLVDLAVRGYLRIEEIPKKWFFSKPDWFLIKLDGGDGKLLDYESELLEGLFLGADEEAELAELRADQGTPPPRPDALVRATAQEVAVVKLSNLKQKFSARLKAVQDHLYRDVVARGWFAGRPDQVRLKWAGRGWGLLLAGLALTWLVAARTHLGLVPIPVALAGLLLIHGAQDMPRRTARGTGMVRRVYGFRTYIETAEKQEAQFQEKENIFSKYLPFAVVFGATEKWARAFAPLGQELPDTTSWYVGSHPFTVAGFGSAMDSFSTVTAGTISSTPSSSGGSGFGGGGFSGGGGGGGGGGSW